MAFRGLEASITAEPLKKIVLVTDTALAFDWEDATFTKILFLNLQATALLSAYEWESDGDKIVSVAWDSRLFDSREFYDSYFKTWDAPYPCYEQRAKADAGGAWLKDPIVTFKARTKYLTPSGLGMIKSLFCQYGGNIAMKMKAYTAKSTHADEGIGASKDTQKAGGVRTRE
jgi:hypothetical protein